MERETDLHTEGVKITTLTRVHRIYWIKLDRTRNSVHSAGGLKDSGEIVGPELWIRVDTHRVVGPSCGSEWTHTGE